MVLVIQYFVALLVKGLAASKTKMDRFCIIDTQLKADRLSFLGKCVLFCNFGGIHFSIFPAAFMMNKIPFLLTANAQISILCPLHSAALGAITLMN